MANPLITTLSCGVCFFRGREFVNSPECRMHGEDEMTRCDCCGKEFPIDDLDSKPTENSRLRRYRQAQGQPVMLRKAADLGFDFDRLECRKCYGPGYTALGD